MSIHKQEEKLYTPEKYHVDETRLQDIAVQKLKESDSDFILRRSSYITFSTVLEMFEMKDSRASVVPLSATFKMLDGYYKSCFAAVTIGERNTVFVAINPYTRCITDIFTLEELNDCYKKQKSKHKDESRSYEQSLDSDRRIDEFSGYTVLIENGKITEILRA